VAQNGGGSSTGTSSRPRLWAYLERVHALHLRDANSEDCGSVTEHFDPAVQERE
jgi:hypothetical protein